MKLKQTPRHISWKNDSSPKINLPHPSWPEFHFWPISWRQILPLHLKESSNSFWNSLNVCCHFKLICCFKLREWTVFRGISMLIFGYLWKIEIENKWETFRPFDWWGQGLVETNYLNIIWWGFEIKNARKCSLYNGRLSLQI